MNILEAIVLGIIQGLTEFIPISSTAHLTLAGRTLGLIDGDAPHEWTAFLAVVQLGTLAAVIAYFWRDLLRIGTSVILFRRDADARLGWLIALGTVPIVVIGLLLKDVIEGPFTKNLWVIAGSLVGLAILLYIAERVGEQRRDMHGLRKRDALLVGFTQTIALIPGASRSGSTIMGGLFAGLDRETAARFSFLLSVPAIMGSALFQLPTALDARDLGAGVVVMSVLAAAIAGYASIEFLLRFLRRRPTHVFVGYRIALGVGIAALLWAGAIAPF